MSRLPDFADPAHVPGWAVAGTLGVVVAATLGLSAATDEPAAAPLPPYEFCVEAANDPVSGFATEVCEPLAPGYVETDLTDYVYTGPMSWEVPGGTVSVPGLAEDVADGCADQPEALLDCVAAIIGQRMGHTP